MDPARWERVKAVYHSALDRDPGERAAFLDNACQDDREVLREVESLLAQASGDSFLERPAWQADDSKETDGPPAGPHPFLWIVGITLAGLIALFGYAAWKMPRDVASFGWAEARRGAVWQVTGVDPAGPAAGKLQPGDRLISLNGDPNVPRAGTQPYRRFLNIGERYRIEINRGGETKEYTLETGRGRPDVRNRLSYFLIGLAWCIVALFIGFARPQDALARLAFVAATMTGVVFMTVGNLPGFYALQPLHVVLGYHFFYRFPGSPPRAKAWRVLLWFLYLCTAVNIANWARLTSLRHVQGLQAATAWRVSPLFMPFGVLIAVTGGMAMLASVAVAIYKYRALTDQDQRRRFHWVAVGGVVGLAPPALWGVLNVIRLWPDAFSRLMSAQGWILFSLVVNTASVAVPVSVAYAVVKHRVFDVKVAIRRGIQYLLARRALQALLAVPSAALGYTLMAHHDRTIEELVTGTTAYLYWILALGLSLKFRSPLVRWLDRKFFHEQYDREQVVLSLVDDLARFDSVQEMTGFAFQQLERSLHPKSMHLWWREGSEMRLAYSSDPSLESARLPLSDPLLERLERLGTVAEVPLPAETGVSSGESRWLAKWGARLIVPVVGPERLEGILMLGEKRSEEPYSASDGRLLHAVARQTAVVRDNLRLKVQVIDEQRIRHEVLAKLDRGLVNLLQECPVCGACFDSHAEVCDRDGHPLTVTLPVARTIDEKYRLEQLIGRGGMGAVYEARDLRLKRQVAVKIMLGGGFGHDTALRRFRREAQAAARLNHPNIVSLYDFGELDGGGAYLVMERIHGVTLRAEMKRVGVFAPAEIANWFEQMLDGLAAAHEHGVIHRDFKPENILGGRRASGSLVVKILDFGLAKSRPLASAAPASQSLTESGVMLGTLAYMAPEQLLGKEVDQRADLYAAGVILAEMLTGRRPFEDGGPQTDRCPALDAVLQRCLAKAPGERFPSATELRAALIPALRACDPGLHA
jgi:GAF domain-containing protein